MAIEARGGVIMSASGYVHLDVDLIVRETTKAFLLRLEDDDHTEVWVPKSMIADCGDYEVNDHHCTVSVRSWFAEKEGLAG